MDLTSNLARNGETAVELAKLLFLKKTSKKTTYIFYKREDLQNFDKAMSNDYFHENNI